MLRRTILMAEALTEKRRRKTQTNLKTKAPAEMTTPVSHDLKPVKRNLHPPTLALSAPSMSSIASGDPDLGNKIPVEPFAYDTRTLIEEIATAIAEAQSALFAGRIQDLETSIIHQQELCAALKTVQDNNFSSHDSDARELVTTAQRVREQSLLFGAVVRRMHRHLNTLRNLLNGLSLTYQPKPVKVPGRES